MWHASACSDAAAATAAVAAEFAPATASVHRRGVRARCLGQYNPTQRVVRAYITHQCAPELLLLLSAAVRLAMCRQRTESEARAQVTSARAHASAQRELLSEYRRHHGDHHHRLHHPASSRTKPPSHQPNAHGKQMHKHASITHIFARAYCTFMHNDCALYRTTTTYYDYYALGGATPLLFSIACAL